MLIIIDITTLRKLIMKTIMFVLFLMPFALFAGQTQNEKLEFCKAMTEVIQKQLPMKTDQITILNSVTCSPTNPPTFLYDYIIELDSKGEYAGAIKESIEINRKEQLNLWCTSPDKQMIISDFNIQTDTRDKNGIHLDKILLTSSDCTN
jgi:hypothetical protein